MDGQILAIEVATLQILREKIKLHPWKQSSIVSDSEKERKRKGKIIQGKKNWVW